MIVLDASFLIAAENHAEVNHDFASKFMVENRMFLAMHWFTISEYLVYPASGGFADVEYDGLINNVRIHELTGPVNQICPGQSAWQIFARAPASRCPMRLCLPPRRRLAVRSDRLTLPCAKRRRPRASRSSPSDSSPAERAISG